MNYVYPTNATYTTTEKILKKRLSVQKQGQEESISKIINFQLR